MDVDNNPCSRRGSEGQFLTPARGRGRGGPEFGSLSNFRVAKALWAFNVPPACIIPHSWKVIETMVWYYEHKGCSADQYLRRELLTHRSSQGYVEFLVRRDVKGIDNPPVCISGWELRFSLPG
ncbi:hypothetical protein ACLOJK_029306 [Asimina triloba]